TTTSKYGYTPTSIPLSEKPYNTQKPIMQQSHQSTISSCSFINQHQQKQALFDSNNSYESVPNNNQEIIHNSCDKSYSSIISSDEDGLEMSDEQIREMAATLPGQVSKEALKYQMFLTAAMKYQYEKENCGNPAKTAWVLT
ncbi:hypothetical protein PV327_011702, partial [Microctonus hyperodae]